MGVGSLAASTPYLAIILATKTYGRQTNALFCTSAEMNYIVGNDRKQYYLVRMIPLGEDWAEPLTTMAFPPSIMFKLWLPGTPMPDDLVTEVCAKLDEQQPPSTQPSQPLPLQWLPPSWRQSLPGTAQQASTDQLPAACSRPRLATASEEPSLYTC